MSLRPIWKITTGLKKVAKAFNLYLDFREASNLVDSYLGEGQSGKNKFSEFVLKSMLSLQQARSEHANLQEKLRVVTHEKNCAVANERKTKVVIWVVMGIVITGVLLFLKPPMLRCFLD